MGVHSRRNVSEDNGEGAMICPNCGHEMFFDGKRWVCPECEYQSDLDVEEVSFR